MLPKPYLWVSGCKITKNLQYLCNKYRKSFVFSNFFLEEYFFEYRNSLVNGGDLPCFTDKKTSKV